MPVLVEPVPDRLAGPLRQAVHALRTAEPRRVFAPVVHVGRPGGVEVSCAAREAGVLDHALCSDLVGALLRRADRSAVPPLLWLTRPGELALHDVDAAWLAAARTAYAEAGLPLRMVVVTPQGWWDPRSDTKRAWKRLRQR